MDQPTQPADPGVPAPPSTAPPPPASPPPSLPGDAPTSPASWPPPPAAPLGAAYPPPTVAAPPPAPPGSWVTPLEPEGPAPGLRFAPHGARLVAYIVDGILVSVLVVGVAIALGLLAAGLAVGGAVPLAALTGILVVVSVFAISLGYFPWFWVNGGATPGMRIFNLRVVRDRDGGPIGWGEAVLRVIGLWLGAAIFYLGYIWILIDKRRRGWHDLIAGTVVVQPA